MIQPFEDEVKDDIPNYRYLQWKHRSKWTCNRLLWMQYRIMRTFLVSIWLYYIPFLALACNFLIPYLIEYKTESVVDGSTMGEEYEEWLSGVLNEDAQGDYDEPSLQELVEMMKAIPLETDEWK